MIEIISDSEGKVLCHIIRNSYSPSGTEFYTPESYSQQLGIIKYPKEGKIKPHYHNELVREVFYTQEVLVIRKGSVRVDLYNNSTLDFHSSVILNQGDTILLASGGHGFEMLDDCEMLEIKQGPYNGVTNDKTHIQ
jgi:hypothetical protein